MPIAESACANIKSCRRGRISMSSSERMISACEPDAAEKVAFVKAVFKGIESGTEAARIVERKKQGEAAAPQVELLRRIPAQPSPESQPLHKLSASMLAVAAEIEAAVSADDPGRIDVRAQQALMSALCRLYAANDERGNHFDVLSEQTMVTATDAMVLCGALLKAVDLQVFEFALWQSWSSR
ncbi:hypothetical protein [Sinorhizobium chiapasense]|uniref:Uncharacterized protein n=1 Tax=Sinorhizobium chiapasense TaxID=501572 RepID=A0ABZ2BHG0_9HYPH